VLTVELIVILLFFQEPRF